MHRTKLTASQAHLEGCLCWSTHSLEHSFRAVQLGFIAGCTHLSYTAEAVVQPMARQALNSTLVGVVGAACSRQIITAEQEMRD